MREKRNHTRSEKILLSKIPPKELEFIEKLESQIGLVHIGESDDYGGIRIENSHIAGIFLEYRSLTEVPDCINNLTELKDVILDNNDLISLPESLTKLTKLEYLCLSENNFMFLSDGLGRWLIEQEDAGCEITGISTKRIKTLWEIPPEEKEFILKLEKFTGLLPLWQNDIENRPPSAGKSQVSFFSVEDNHINIVRIKDHNCDGHSTSILEPLSYIGNLKNLEELTIAGYKSEWSMIQTIIKQKFPDRFVVRFCDYEINYIMEICFFPKDGLEGLDGIFGLSYKGRSPQKYYGGIR
ncbi:hypothetical protein CEE45_15790 [Candidatus Heimdallarchaeota archaeon B3_Heim]|nr:MAG: hypothetical protein CEE45_15790 [Candidatus Heimdallarchaeota archaeon B3_Heim]